MKKLLILLLFFCASVAWSQSEKIVVSLETGGSDEYSIMDVQELVFEGEKWETAIKIVFNNEEEPVSYLLSDISKIDFLPVDLDIAVYVNVDGVQETVMTSTFDKIVFDDGLGVDEISENGELAFKNTYPNPFSSSVTIEFEMKNSGRTIVDILDVHGNVVAELRNQFIEAGTTTLVWEGKTTDGLAVESGVYFCRVQSGENAIMKKLFMVK